MISLPMISITNHKLNVQCGELIAVDVKPLVA